MGWGSAGTDVPAKVYPYTNMVVRMREEWGGVCVCGGGGGGGWVVATDPLKALLERHGLGLASVHIRGVGMRLPSHVYTLLLSPLDCQNFLDSTSRLTRQEFPPN